MNTAAEQRTAFGVVKPRWTYILLGAIVAIFILQWLTDTFVEEDLFIYFGAKINVFIKAGEWWRLITPMFLHADILHIAFNSYALFVFGREVEAFFGYRRFLLLYFVSGMAGSVASFWLEPRGISVGASGAIMGLLAASAIFFYENKQFFGTFGRSRLINALILIAINIFLVFDGRTDVWGHFGGVVGGVLTSIFLAPLWRVDFDQTHLKRIITDEHSLTGQRWLIAAGLLVMPFLLVYASLFMR